jgi:GT2 family glycosyltransferase
MTDSNVLAWPRVAVLLTCFNRRATTLRCLDALYRQSFEFPRSIDVTLVDDGSTDGTGDAVANAFPEVHLVKGSGSLFWVGGMRVAYEYAMKRNPDYILFLNDDSILVDHALDTMLHTLRELSDAHGPCIVTGTMVDPGTGKRTYGGTVLHVNFGLVRHSQLDSYPNRARECTFGNFNCTLVPRAVALRLGNLEKRFSQMRGDYDYCLRARRAGFRVWIAPGLIGSCARNSIRGTWQDRSLSLRERWNHLNSPKGAPIRETSLYYFRHWGVPGLLYAVSPYVKTILGIGLRRFD